MAANDVVMTHQCNYCQRQFQREQSLLVHVCETKRRFLEQQEIGVQIGLRAYLRFYEITQGSSRLKTFDDFARSAYYRAFVKFGRHCQAIRAINVERFADWLIRENKKIDHWCRDTMYQEYLMQYIRQEHVDDAIARAIETGLDWHETHPDLQPHHILRYGNDNALCHAITTGRISPWVLYHCESGQCFLGRINSEQITMIWPMIDSDFWQRKFRDYPADAAYATDILQKAGW